MSVLHCLTCDSFHQCGISRGNIGDCFDEHLERNLIDWQHFPRKCSRFQQALRTFNRKFRREVEAPLRART